MKDERKLNKKHLLFIDNYLKMNLNATRAYMEVYNCSEASARTAGSKLLTNDNIKNAINERLSQINNEKLLEIEDVMLRLSKIAVGDKEIVESEEVIGFGEEGEVFRATKSRNANIREQLKALELIGRVHNMFDKKEEAEHKVKITNTMFLTEEEVEEGENEW